MEKFKDANKWVRFGLSLVVGVVLLFALVFEISISVPVFEPAPQPDVVDVGSQAVRERIGIDSRVDSYFYNGADLTFYSDDHSTGTITMTGDTGAIEATTFTVTNFITSSTSLDLSGGLDVDGTSDLDNLDVDASAEIEIDGALTDFGGGTCGVADGDNDVCIAAVLEVDGELELDGALDADSTANIAGAVVLGSTLDVSGGDITLENDETISNSTDGRVVVGGDLGYKTIVIDKTAAYTVTTAESGALFTNDGASGAITFTLPSLAGGLSYCFTANDNQTVAVDPDGTDQILSETNAAGDMITSGAQFDVICLVGVTDGWLPVETTGTWADAN